MANNINELLSRKRNKTYFFALGAGKDSQLNDDNIHACATTQTGTVTYVNIIAYQSPRQLRGGGGPTTN